MRVLLRRLLIAVVVLALGLLLAFQLAVRTLRTQVETALGPRGEVARIEVGFGGVVLHDVRIRADSGATPRWPAADELRARRVEVVPQLRDLLSARVRIARITVDGAYLSMLRTRNGSLRMLPGLLGQTDAPSAEPLPVHVARIELRDGALDFFDASVGRTPHRLALVDVTADITPLDLPALDSRMTIDVTATVKGPNRDGTLALRGELVPARRDAKLEFALHDADLVAFQPYLIRAAETGVRQGTMDLDIRPVVSAGQIKAPGTLTLSRVRLASGNTFMGLPRAAMVKLLGDRNERISVDFTLEGRLDDPQFSLNENFATRVAGSLADSLGVSLGGLVRGVGSAGGAVVEGVGEAVGKLFGK